MCATLSETELVLVGWRSISIHGLGNDSGGAKLVANCLTMVCASMSIGMGSACACVSCDCRLGMSIFEFGVT